MLQFLAFSVIFVLLSVKIQTVKAIESDSTLKLVHVIFRHGERTVDVSTNYPNDPYLNETFYPYGKGQLTNKGKQTEYRLGKALRKRYNKFLGDIYFPNLIDALSSSANRTKMSLDLVLAGLFPPVREQIWDEELHWQPIPFNFQPISEDKIFLVFMSPEYKRLLKNYQNSPKALAELEQYRETINLASEKAGKIFETFFDLYKLYNNFEVLGELGYELPEWSKQVYPKPLKEIATKFVPEFIATTEMKRILAGGLIKKIIEDTEAKLNRKRPETKMFLYSGHDFNLGFLMGTLEIFKEHFPYGAYLLFEIHNINGVDGIKIFYQDYTNEEPMLLKLPACEEFCPINKFVSLVEEYLPVNEEIYKKEA